MPGDVERRAAPKQVQLAVKVIFDDPMYRVAAVTEPASHGQSNQRHGIEVGAKAETIQSKYPSLADKREDQSNSI
jgi:hypothetical protein